MSDFDPGLPEFEEDSSLQEQFFNYFLQGEWRPILKEDRYKQLLSWLTTFKKKNTKVVVRFKFLESISDQPFAIYCICNSVIKDNKIDITQVCKPDLDLFEIPEKKKFLLAIPTILRKKPLFCIPANDIIGLGTK